MGTPRKMPPDRIDVSERGDSTLVRGRPLPRMTLSLWFMVLLTGLSGLLNVAHGALATAHYDVIIRDARVLDGSGNPWILADVAVSGDRIVRIGQIDTQAQARISIDGSGLYLSPGFIDTHSHAREAVESKDRSGATGLLLQGVTTILLNPDGGGPVDLNAQIKNVLTDGIGVNVGLMVPHGSVRAAVVGLDDRRPSLAEMTQMQGLVRAGMEAGAFGLTSGTFYAPGSYADNSELITLSQVVADYDGVYASHIRDESDYSIGLIAAVQEVIDVAEAAKIRAVVTHVKALGPRVWGLGRDVVSMIRQARLRGVQVYTDQYPYAASSTSLSAALMPRWAVAGGRKRFLERLEDEQDLVRIRDAMVENLARRGGATRIMISVFNEAPALAGQLLSDLASQSETDVQDYVLEVLKIGSPKIISFNMQAHDIAELMVPAWNMTASDGRYPPPGIGPVHPRAFGTFPRKIREYVLNQKIVTLEHAIRSMTSLPAQVYNIPARGQIREGAYADLVLFSLEEIKDQATFTDPYQFAEGVHHVLVNGEVVLKEGKSNGQLNGRLIRRGEQ